LRLGDESALVGAGIREQYNCRKRAGIGGSLFVALMVVNIGNVNREGRKGE